MFDGSQEEKISTFTFIGWLAMIVYVILHVLQNSVAKKVEVDSTPSSRTESQVPSPQSVGGDIVVEDVSVKEEPKVFPFKNASYDVRERFVFISPVSHSPICLCG